jgi:hypothetical protein
MAWTLTTISAVCVDGQQQSTTKAYYDNVLMSSSDEDSNGETEILVAAASMVNEHFLMPPRRGGSSKKREGNVDRDREAGHVHLYKDYFDPIKPIYEANEFCHRYKMSRELFLVILNCVRDYDDYFEAKYDCTGKIGFSSYQKCSATVQQLAYGVLGDIIDDYIRMSGCTCHEAMYRFCEDVIAMFGEYYLREPNMDDTARLLSINESRGFLGCLAALTACIGSGRTVLFVGKSSSKGIRRGAPLYWRLLPNRIFGFDTPSLV